MPPTLDPVFLGPPLAHRGLHDRAAGRAENSLAAFRAAIAGGYGIELDVQASSDGVAMAFHDEELGRLTSETGPVNTRTAAELTGIPLTGGNGDTIPTLADVLALVAGRVPLLIEIKDQDGALGPDMGPLPHAVARDLKRYTGPVAIMSFNPHAVADFGKALPGICLGLTTCDFSSEEWPDVPAARRHELAAIGGLDDVGATFISHDVKKLDNPRLAELSRAGVPILCWTVRDPVTEARARSIVQNVTFEGYAAALTPPRPTPS